MNKIFVLSLFIFLLLLGNLIPSVGAADEDIAQEYAPIFYFEKDETCFPVDVSYHISNSYLYQVDVVAPIHQSPTADMIASYTDTSYYLDNLKGTIYDDAIITDYKSSGFGYTVYAHVFTSGGLTYVQYWLFYAFNMGTMNQHEGDWEMVQVVLSGGTPSEVMYSQHHGGQIATWDQVEREGNHIKVFVSRGSHANYLRSYSGVVGVANDIVGANGRKLTSSEYDMLMLESQSWLNFGGLWGWSGRNEEEFNAASLLGQTGPNGPKYRENGAMWNGIGWENSLSAADNNIFILELFLYNFVTIFVIIAFLIVGILLYRIYKRKKTTGLGPRIISIFYIDGLNLKSMGNILCLIGILLAIIALVNPWYVVSTDVGISGYETDGMADMITVDGITGIQIQVPGVTGPIPMGSVMIPFSLLIGIGLVFLIIASIGVSQSKKLGKKYIFRGVRLMIPIIIIIIFIFSLRQIFLTLFQVQFLLTAALQNHDFAFWYE
ncbi:MAG: Vps62-related protein, partial [Thermoplasmatales archaeon]|nr:Vps62-related protein [Thermoplasmatales archaeon]